ncbi:MAG TPA: hypothetical protein VLL25_11725 [Acidimicrobiales bacterium]|nr:hypothetical protein [Acidimicrobiales bacterium]
MPTPCRRHRPTDVLPSYLLCPDDALDLLWAIEAEHPDSIHIVLVVDRARRGVLAMPVTADGADVERPIGPVADVLMKSLAGNPDGPMGLVLCSLRPGQGVEAGPADIETWDRLRARCRDAEIDLLDWFLFDRPYSTSMAETQGYGWPQP